MTYVIITVFISIIIFMINRYHCCVTINVRTIFDDGIIFSIYFHLLTFSRDTDTRVFKEQDAPSGFALPRGPRLRPTSQLAR